MDLRAYEQEKFAIAEVLRAASAMADPERRDWHNHARGLFARLAEDRFNLVMVGRFSRGKSTLMNALLGMDRLPTGIVPLTSVITTVGYGSKERAVLRFRDSMLTTEIPIARLPDYVTQQGNPGNAKRIETAEVQLPAELLRRGFYFVDTPGLGSAIAANTRTTESFLPEGDAFLLVTSYESPLSDEELRFLRATASSARRVFVVLNKQDMVSSDERSQALAFVTDALRSALGPSAPSIFSVSAREAIAAKLNGDASRLAGSAVPILEEALLKFLLAEKSTQLLLAMCGRAVDLIRELPRTPATGRLLEQIGSLASKLDPERTPPVQGAPISAPAPSFVGLHELAPCEICTHVATAVWDFLCKYQWAISTDLQQQRVFAARGGLCNFHTWDYHGTVSSQGTSTAFPALAERLAAYFRNTASQGFDPADTLPARLNRLLPSEDTCPMCRVQAKAETDALAGLARRLSAQPSALDQLSGICVPHIALLVPLLKDMSLVRKLIARQGAVLERIAEDMRRYAIKREGAKRWLMSDEEEKAADRAIMLLVGHKTLNVVRKTGGGLPGARGEVSESDKRERA